MRLCALLLCVVLAGCGRGGPPSTPIVQYLAATDTGSVVLSGTCRLTDSYYSDFSTAEKNFYSFDLVDNSSSGINIYAARESGEGRKLYEATKDGAKRTATVKVIPGTKSRRVAEVIQVISVR